MTEKSRLFGLAGLIAVILGFIGKSFYREYIKLHEINDFGIAGFLPSYFYVLGFSLLLLILPAKFPKTVILVVTSASILFELKQYFSTDILDVNDILASVAGGITSILIYRFIDRKF
jgi:hypothetical protein